MKKISLSSFLLASVTLSSVIVYVGEELPHLLQKPPQNNGWLLAADHEVLTFKSSSQFLGSTTHGVLDAIKIGGKRVQDGQIESDPFNAGLEVTGWMLPTHYPHRWYQADTVWMTLYNDKNRYHFEGMNIDRQDVAKAFHLPSVRIGFQFRADLTQVSPGRYQAQIHRVSGSLTTAICLIRH